MKSLLFSAVLISSASFAQVESRLVKVLDGSRAVCKTKLDMTENRLGAYRLSKKTVDLEQETLKIDLGIEFFQCDEFDGEIGFKKIGVLESFTQTNLIAGAKMQVDTVKAELLNYRDRDFKVLSKTELGARTNNIALDVALADLLSPEDYSRMHSGEVIKTSVDSSLIKIVKIKLRETEIKERISFGAFRLLMEIKMVDGVLKARLI